MTIDGISRLAGRAALAALLCIGSALAGRMVGEHLRGMGVATSGPPPFGPRDRSRFLQALDRAVVMAKRA